MSCSIDSKAREESRSCDMLERRNVLIKLSLEKLRSAADTVPGSVNNKGLAIGIQPGFPGDKKTADEGTGGY